MVGCIGGWLIIERVLNEPLGVGAARCNLVVCGIVLGTGGDILPGLLWSEDIFEAAHYWYGAAALCMAAGIARERMDYRRAGSELGEATWLA
jgi:hypothetical protein